MSEPVRPGGPADPDDVDRRFREIVSGLTDRSHLGTGTPEGMATDFRSYEPPEEDDHFVPPPTPPLPAGDLHFWAIVVGLVGGPLLVFLSAVVPLLGRGWTSVGATLTLVGFGLLILRQPSRRRRDDDWGAQV
ncbi:MULTISPECIES: hypothetical protein [unclassified Ornithinimicrobium]|uniref:hypothetical protein n=1 Tax=unclassified Ornithinimicrobium TaxID=2615080 RepID=UPI003852CDAB